MATLLDHSELTEEDVGKIYRITTENCPNVTIKKLTPSAGMSSNDITSMTSGFGQLMSITKQDGSPFIKSDRQSGITATFKALSSTSEVMDPPAIYIVKIVTPEGYTTLKNNKCFTLLPEPIPTNSAGYPTMGGKRRRRANRRTKRRSMRKRSTKRRKSSN
jgi:hypothetical protein